MTYNQTTDGIRLGKPGDILIQCGACQGMGYDTGFMSGGSTCSNCEGKGRLWARVLTADILAEADAEHERLRGIDGKMGWGPVAYGFSKRCRGDRGSHRLDRGQKKPYIGDVFNFVLGQQKLVRVRAGRFSAGRPFYIEHRVRESAPWQAPDDAKHKTLEEALSAARAQYERLCPSEVAKLHAHDQLKALIDDRPTRLKMMHIPHPHPNHPLLDLYDYALWGLANDQEIAVLRKVQRALST